jgi:hypothetical protein
MQTRIRLTGHVARMRRKNNTKRLLLDKPKGEKTLETPRLDVIIFK